MGNQWENIREKSVGNNCGRSVAKVVGMFRPTRCEDVLKRFKIYGLAAMEGLPSCLVTNQGNVVEVVGIELRGMIGVGDGDESDVISLWTGADEFEQESGLQESIEKTMQGTAKKGALPQPPFLFCK
ncbi:hypothetical protein Tco_1271581, partial [Tanacetum coccineum]